MKLLADAIILIWILMPQYTNSTKEVMMLEISTLLRSNSRKKFSSDALYFEAHDSLLREIKKKSTFDKAHPFVIDLFQDCFRCHDSLIHSLSSSERYRIISTDKAIFHGTITEIENMQSWNYHSIKRYIPLIPDAKIDISLYEMLETSVLKGGCKMDTDIKEVRSQIKLSVIVAPMTLQELNIFKVEIKLMGEDLTALFIFDYNELQENTERAAHITIHNCSHVEVVAKKLSNRREILWIEGSHDIQTSNKWGKGICQSGDYSETPVYNANLTGENQIVGVADTGVDMQSCYFIDPSTPVPYNKVSTSHRKIVTYIAGQDLVDDSTNGHGTHVCGSLAGKCNKDWNDYKAFNGVAYNAKIAFYDIGLAGSYTLNPPSNLESGLFGPMYSAGARIFSNSWGAPSDNSYNYLSVSVDRFMWNNPDALVIFAAGNDGPYSGSIDAPSTNKNGIAVGASLNDYDSWLLYGGSDSNSDTSNSNAIAGSTVFSGNSMAFFSSQGPTSDGRMKPDVMAPGWWITSAASATPPTSSSGISAYNSSSPSHCSLKGMRGTSMSTPIVAGNAALIREYFTKGFYPSGAASSKDAFVPSGALLKAMLIHSSRALAYSVSSDSSGHYAASSLASDIYPTNLQGFGRIQLSNILPFADSRSSSLTLFVVGAADSGSSNYKALRNGESEKHIFYTTADAIQPSIRITLVYTDYPGSSGSSKPLVNDLNIVVVDNSGAVLHRPQSYVQGQADINNVEMILINNPLPSTTYTVVVSSGNTLAYLQPYALVMTGQITPVRMRRIRTFAASVKHYFQYPNLSIGLAFCAFASMLIFSSFICMHFNRVNQIKAERKGAVISIRRVRAPNV